MVRMVMVRMMMGFIFKILFELSCRQFREARGAVMVVEVIVIIIINHQCCAFHVTSDHLVI